MWESDRLTRGISQTDLDMTWRRWVSDMVGSDILYLVDCCRCIYCKRANIRGGFNFAMFAVDDFSAKLKPPRSFYNTYVYSYLLLNVHLTIRNLRISVGVYMTLMWGSDRLTRGISQTDLDITWRRWVSDMLGSNIFYLLDFCGCIYDIDVGIRQTDLDMT